MHFGIYTLMKKNLKINFKLLVTCLIITSLISSPIFINTTFAADDDKVVILHTGSGPLVIEFFPDDAPITTENFLDLIESGFYDKTLQGGDPLTKYDEDGFTNTSSWGTGDAGHNIPAEFNDIKHDRGIVSMARGMDHDSASSQFFIVHQDSNHLDGQYTVFGRLLTSESFTTLDKIANLSTTQFAGLRDVPNQYDPAKITKTELVTRAEIENPLNQGEPTRVEPIDTTVKGWFEENTDTSNITNERFISVEHDFSVIPPQGWTILYPEPGSGKDDPVITFYFSKQWTSNAGSFPPFITIHANKLGEHAFQEHIETRVSEYHDLQEQGKLEILSEQTETYVTKQNDQYGAYILFAKQKSLGGWVKFAQNIISHGEFVYGITYASHLDIFDDGLYNHHNVLESFAQVSDTPDQNGKFDKILESAGIEKIEPTDTTEKLEAERIKAIAEEMAEDAKKLETEGGGCLIATAAFGSEMEPQIQLLREIRDNTVLQTHTGTSFMTTFNQFYYSFSPVIADYERENPAFKEVVKLTLTPLLTSLMLLQHTDIDSESEMLGYGISIILLNIGMYFVAPTALIIGLRKFYKVQ